MTEKWAIKSGFPQLPQFPVLRSLASSLAISPAQSPMIAGYATDATYKRAC